MVGGMETHTQITLRLHDVQARLGELAAIEDQDEEQRSEMESLRSEFTDLQRRAAAAMAAQDRSLTAGDGDPEPDRAELRAQCNVGEIADAAMGRGEPGGATRELQEELGLAPNMVPVEVLEFRAVTPAPAGVERSTQPVLGQVFARSANEFLSIQRPTVPVGDAVYPVLTSTTTATSVAGNASTAVSETTGAFTANVLTPSRLQAAFHFRRTEAARFGSLDQSLRDNLSAALADGLDAQTIAGLLADLTDPTAPTTEADWAAYLALIADAAVIDGIYCTSPAEARLLVNPDTIAHMMTAVRSGNAADVTAYDLLMRLSGGVRVSAHMPATASNDAQLIVRKGTIPAAVTPLWAGVELIRDEVTRAQQGEIVLTAVLLYNYETLRTAAFAQKAVQLA